MTDADGDLSKFREIAVVLGGGLHPDGTPTRSTVNRAQTAADLASVRDVAVIASGSHGDGPKPERTEAEIMAAQLFERGLDRGRVFIEDQSRDTLSNAAFVAERYLAALTPRRLIIVTSPFHLDRALETFALVLGPDWPLEGYPSAPTPNDDAHARTEALYLGHTRARLEGIRPGDLPRIVARVRETLPENVSDERRR